MFVLSCHVIGIEEEVGEDEFEDAEFRSNVWDDRDFEDIQQLYVQE